MRIFILFVFLTYVPLSLNAQQNPKYDLHLGLQARSLPSIGGEVFVDTGYNLLTWDQRSKKNFLFGLIRPSVGFHSSAVINTGRVELEIFPISFIGFSVGRQFIHSNFDFPFLDCDKLACRGSFERNFVEPKIALGLKGWALTAHYRIEKLTSPNKEKQMADWKNVIAGNIGRDIQLERRFVLGKKIKNNFMGVLYENVEFQGSGQRKESIIALFQKNKEIKSHLFGAGIFKTNLQPLGLQVYYRLNFKILPYTKLF